MGNDMTQTATARAVQFDRWGGRDVLYVGTVPMPVAAAGEVVVAVKAAGINPGEAGIRSGGYDGRAPGSFPSGQGSDLAGIVVEVGAGVNDLAVGDEVLGFSWKRSSQATHVTVPAAQLIAKPAELSWAVAGSLYVVACAAYAAVGAVDPQPGETVAVSGAAGGVGTVVVQLLALRGIHILAIASETNDAWLTDHGATPVNYGPGLPERLLAAAPDGIDAFIDLFGSEYVHLAVGLGIDRGRIQTIIAFQMAHLLGTRSESSESVSNRSVLREMAGLVARGDIEIPIAATYPLDDVQDAFGELERRHTRGKIVLIP
jgi:NADPH:quinone reductase-like Zn-dependent oxidoreductase